MLGVRDGPAGGWNRLLKAVEAQVSLLEAMKETTEEALGVVRLTDLGKLEQVLARREKLMHQVENSQKRERELRPKDGKDLPANLKLELETAERHIWLLLEKTIALNDKLEEGLRELRQQLNLERKKLGKLRQTAEGYKPKELAGEGLFVDRKS